MCNILSSDPTTNCFVVLLKENMSITMARHTCRNAVFFHTYCNTAYSHSRPRILKLTPWLVLRDRNRYFSGEIIKQGQFAQQPYSIDGDRLWRITYHNQKQTLLVPHETRFLSLEGYSKYKTYKTVKEIMIISFMGKIMFHW